MSCDTGISLEGFARHEVDHPIRIFSGEGGGIRGIVQAKIGEELENRTHKSLSELFDLMVCTSTSAFTALGTSTPNENGEPKYKAGEIVKLYEKEGKNVFKESCIRKLLSLNYIKKPKYPACQMKNITKKYFGEDELQNCLTEIVVLTYEITKGNPWYFSRNISQQSEDDLHNIKIKDVVNAATAAPTYFSPHPIELNGTQYAFIDGGVYKKDPSNLADSVSDKIWGSCQKKIICSFGTGVSNIEIPYKKAKDWGLIHWAIPAIDISQKGQTSSTSKDMKNRESNPHSNIKFYELQPNVEVTSLDDASKENINQLIDGTKQFIEENEDLLNELSNELLKNGNNERLAEYNFD